MIALKKTPLKRWYRVKDNVVYDILTKEPNSEIVQDAIPYNKHDNLLPRIKLTYGYYDNNMTFYNIGYVEYLYLDNFIEVGDNFDGGKKFAPYINNNELSMNEVSTYFNIHKEDVINSICKNITYDGLSKDKIVDTLPLYFQEKITVKNNENNVLVIPVPNRTVSVDKTTETINCIYTIELEGVYYLEKNTYVQSQFIDFDYDATVIHCVNNYCQQIAQNICNKHDLCLYNIKDIVSMGKAEMWKSDNNKIIYTAEGVSLETPANFQVKTVYLDKCLKDKVDIISGFNLEKDDKGLFIFNDEYSSGEYFYFVE